MLLDKIQTEMHVDKCTILFFPEAFQLSALLSFFAAGCSQPLVSLSLQKHFQRNIFSWKTDLPKLITYVNFKET